MSYSPVFNPAATNFNLGNYMANGLQAGQKEYATQLNNQILPQMNHEALQKAILTNAYQKLVNQNYPDLVKSQINEHNALANYYPALANQATGELDLKRWEAYRQYAAFQALNKALGGPSSDDNNVTPPPGMTNDANNGNQQPQNYPASIQPPIQPQNLGSPGSGQSVVYNPEQAQNNAPIADDNLPKLPANNLPTRYFGNNPTQLTLTPNLQTATAINGGKPPQINDNAQANSIATISPTNNSFIASIPKIGSGTAMDNYIMSNSPLAKQRALINNVKSLLPVLSYSGNAPLANHLLTIASQQNPAAKQESVNTGKSLQDSAKAAQSAANIIPLAQEYLQIAKKINPLEKLPGVRKVAGDVDSDFNKLENLSNNIAQYQKDLLGLPAGAFRPTEIGYLRETTGDPSKQPFDSAVTSINRVLDIAKRAQVNNNLLQNHVAKYGTSFGYQPYMGSELATNVTIPKFDNAANFQKWYASLPAEQQQAVRQKLPSGKKGRK